MDIYLCICCCILGAGEIFYLICYARSRSACILYWFKIWYICKYAHICMYVYPRLMAFQGFFLSIAFKRAGFMKFCIYSCSILGILKLEAVCLLFKLNA